MEWIKRAWRGQERIWIVFWLYGVLGGIGFAIAMAILSLVMGMAGAGIAAPFLVIAADIAYIVWLWVSEWRCAFNLEWRFWGYVVRVLVVLKLICVPLVFIGFVIGGVLVGHDLIKAAQCRKDAQEYMQKGGTDVEGFKHQCYERQKHGGAAPASSLAPLPSLSGATLANQEAYSQQCQKTMADYAQKNGADPQTYIAQNQAWLQQCIQHYINSAPAVNPATAAPAASPVTP